MISQYQTYLVLAISIFNLLAFHPLNSLELDRKLKIDPISKPYKDFDDNPIFSSSERNSTRPYLIPQDHPIYPILSQLFATRVTENTQTFEAAGFQILSVRSGSMIKVARHPLLPGYIIKVYLDDHVKLKENIPDWQWFVYRCQGAKRVANVIEKHHIKHFTVPKKWLFPLPGSTIPPADPTYIRKHTVLIAEEMPLIPSDENFHLWKQAITKDYLQELYIILTEASSVRSRPDNIHFLPDGRMAIIDTEYPFKKADKKTMIEYLSPEMQKYWKDLNY